ncbi:MAG: ABC transporter ATP-binding protein [Oscillospiraceae bacterium]|nr:ABC transporter ATP-binding protein [Oscillospiraceae bacterium]
MEKAFEIVNLNKTYKDFALKDVNLSLPKGYIMGFVGANGAGKSTTMGCLLGMIKADSGSVKIFGKETAKLTATDKEKIGVVMEGVPFAPMFTLKDINTVLKNVYTSWDSKKFLSLCSRFNLPEKKQIKDYSTGMRAKLNISIAISHSPQLLVLDEATSGLDPVVRDEILDILQDFVCDENHSILMSSHITSDLEKICDYIAFINNGSIVFVENKDTLQEKYAVVHLAKEQYAQLDKTAVVGAKFTDYNVSALVLKDKISGEYTAEKPSVEDIMLYCVKEVK